MNKILLMKFTSRERPDQLLNCVSEYIKLANNTKDMVWLFTFDKDCVCASVEFGNKMIDLFKENNIDGSMAFSIVGESQNKIHAINRDIDRLDKMSFDIKQTYPVKWDVLCNVSDDQFPIVKGYDQIIRDAMPDDLDCSLWFSDGHQMRISTMEIQGRKYYDRFGFIYDPRFKSFFCDNLSTEVAKYLGKQKVSKQCIVKHFHPGWDRSGKVKQDELYKKNDLHWGHDEKLFNFIIQNGIAKYVSETAKY